MIGFPNPIPAHSKVGEDRYLLLGYVGNGDVLVIDQDGDVRETDYSNIQTEWVYLTDMDVWFNRQLTMEDLEGPADAEDQDRNNDSTDDVGDASSQPGVGEGGVPSSGDHV